MALALALALACVTLARANGGGIILTPPRDFTEVAPGSVETILPGVHVRHAVEEDGAVWAATLDHGVAWRAKGARDWAWIDAKSSRLPADAATRVARFRGQTWVGLESAGVARIDGDGKSCTAFGAAAGLPSPEVVELVVFGDRLWVLTTAGLAVWDGKAFGKPPSGGDPVKGLVTCMTVAFDGKLYVGTDQTEIGVLDRDGAWVRYSFAGKIVGRVLRCVGAGVGHIWFGTFGSLNVYTPATGRLDDETAEKAILFPSRIMVALAGTETRMLTATAGGGVYRFDRPTLAWHLYSDANGLPSTAVNALALYGTRLLASTAGGLSTIDLALPLPAELKRAGASPASAAPGVPSATAGASPSPASPFVAPAELGDTSKLPAATSTLGATGRQLLEIPSLLGGKGLTCLTCHRMLHGNPAFTAPGSPAGTVDLTSAFTAPSADDGVKNPRKIPGLYGLRFRGPYPSAGTQASLREYVRAHIVRDLEGPEPSPAALDALEVYLGGLEPPAPRALKPDGQLQLWVGGATQRGSVVFARAFPEMGGLSCASCHDPGRYFTDNRLHKRPDGRWVRTPSLLGALRTAPYLSDGSRRTLRDVVTYYNDAYHLLLKRAECEDLAAYLATIGEVSGP